MFKREITLEWFHPHPPERVWKCLTTPELIAQWLMQNDFKPEVGHKFQFRAKPVPGWSGIVDCKVLEVDQPRKLSYTWTSGPKPGVIKIDTVVTWKLVKVENGTKLVLEHTGFKGFNAWMVSHMLQKGWKGHIAKEFSKLLTTLE